MQAPLPHKAMRKRLHAADYMASDPLNLAFLLNPAALAWPTQYAFAV